MPAAGSIFVQVRGLFSCSWFPLQHAEHLDDITLILTTGKAKKNKISLNPLGSGIQSECTPYVRREGVWGQT